MATRLRVIRIPELSKERRMSEAANAESAMNSATRTNGRHRASNSNGARPKSKQDHKRDQRNENSLETQFTPAMPVGVFDSGVGGLTILQELLRELPDERYVYFGDTGNCPYGVRAEEEIQSLARSAARHLLNRGVKMIVVACNTASVSALANLRATFSNAAPYIHFVGVVPAVKPAAARTRVGRVGVASTEASAKGGYLKRLIADHASGVEVRAVGCPRLVQLVEAGTLEGEEVEAAVREYIQPLLDAGIDTLVLGCTHFPALREVFERVAGPNVKLIDSGSAIARQTRRMLTEKQLLAREGEAAVASRVPNARDEFWCSGDVESFERIASRILGTPIYARYAHAMRVPLPAS